MFVRTFFFFFLSGLFVDGELEELMRQGERELDDCDSLDLAGLLSGSELCF